MCEKLSTNVKALVADGKIHVISVRVGVKVNGAKVYLRGPGIFKAGKTQNGWATIRIKPLRKGVLRVTSPRACNEVRIGIVPPKVPPVAG